MRLKNITYEGAGIENVYSNESWLIALKYWREANDVENISRLEIHFKTDEQFILLKGSVVIIYAEELDEQTIIQAVKLEPGAVFNVPQNTWFNNILSKDAKLAYIESSDTKAAPDNSIYRELTAKQIVEIKEKVRALL